MNIIFPVKVYQKFRAYVEATQYEISGLGKIKREGDKMIIEEVKIFKQRVSAGDTNLDMSALAKFYDNLVKNGEDLSAWKLWWHSHANMNVFFSGIDTATIEDFDNEMYQDNWMLSIVTNRKAEVLARLDIFYPMRTTIHNVDWDVSFDDKEIKGQVIDEVTELVTPAHTPILERRRKKKPNVVSFERSISTSNSIPLLPELIYRPSGILGVDYHYKLGLIVMGPGKSDYIPNYES